jgi:peptide alpha-N-acetyltransferase
MKSLIQANVQILRELSILHIQQLNFEAFNETCAKLLENRPQMRNNWLSYAISFHFLGDFEMAEKVMDGLQEQEKVMEN